MIPMSGKIFKKIPKLIIGKKDTLRKISYNGYFLIVTKSLYFKNRDINCTYLCSFQYYIVSPTVSFK